MQQQKGYGVFAVAGAFVGTIVGAGFATGQEVMRFFSAYGGRGVVGTLGATLLFAFFGALALVISQRLGATSHRELLRAVSGPLIGQLLDVALSLFLFVGASMMMAGSGAVFAEHWQLSRFLGSVLMAGLTIGTVLLGLRGVVTSIAAVAPVLISMVLVVSLSTLFSEGLSRADLAFAAPAQAASPWWPVATVLYVSYNLLFAIPVLAPLGGAATETRKLRLGGWIGGIALGLGSAAINLALLAGLPAVLRYEVPMLYMAGRLPGWVTTVYGIVLWAEIYTTAVSSLFGLVVRFVPAENRARYRLFTLAAGVGALALSQFGFAPMVAVVLPVMGWLALLFVAGLVLQIFRRQRVPAA